MKIALPVTRATSAAFLTSCAQVQRVDSAEQNERTPRRRQSQLMQDYRLQVKEGRDSPLKQCPFCKKVSAANRSFTVHISHSRQRAKVGPNADMRASLACGCCTGQ